ncbi:uroporphyrinogen-III synthase [Pseudoxanthobacter sp.]|uniref:uroporphyrinogen-III synthase n=1 Tax=Pseudoxanthobacter sp. TaxID=1925742 RepID=UPI002FE17FFB
MRVLVTRPQPQAAETGRRLAALGYSVLLTPVLVTEADPTAEIDTRDAAAVAFTSRSAVRALEACLQRSGPPHGLLNLPAFAVGDATAQAARQAGFARVESAGGTAGDLARLILARLPASAGAVLHLAGAERAGDLAGLLQAGGLAARTAVLYRTRAIGALPPPVAAALMAGEVDAVLLYSPRSAAAFAAILADLPASLTSSLPARLPDGAARPLPHIVALSAATKAGFLAVHSSFAAARVRVAAHPDEASLIAALAALARDVAAGRG